MRNTPVRSPANHSDRNLQPAASRRLPLFNLHIWLALLIGVAASAAAETPPASAYAGGSGTELDPWQISNLAQLRLLSESSADWASGTYFIVTADIDATDTNTWNAGMGFSPIGTIGGIPFQGVFDGNGKVISTLFIDRPTQQQVGLFGGQKLGSIKNVHLTGCLITGLREVGGLAGWNLSGTIDSSTVASCTVTGNDYDVGGLVGYIDAGTITSSQTSGVVSAVGSSAGGLVGSTYQATISSSSSSADVTGASEVGGLVGYFNQSSMMSNSASGNIVGGANVGGLVGQLSAPTGPLTLSHATGTVTGSSAVGGLIGYAEYLNVSSSYATGQVIGVGSPKQIGGLIGYASGDTIQDSYANGNVSGIESVGGFVGDANGGSISRCYATGDVSEASATISNGFFGGLAGFADAAITSSYAAGGVSAPDFDNVGGLVGYLGSGTGEINSSYAIGAAGGNDTVGGLVGYCNAGYVTSSYATGTATGAGTKVGALAGDNVNCLNSGLPSYWLDPAGSTVGIGSGGASSGASGLTEAQMLMQSSFTGFVFPDSWVMVEGVKRPYLPWQDLELIFSSGFEALL